MHTRFVTALLLVIFVDRLHASDETLARAVNAKSVVGVKAAIENGADINSVPVLWQLLNRDESQTPFPMVAFYLSLGADPNRAGPDGSSPLHRACEYGFGYMAILQEWMDRDLADIICKLVDAGANVNELNAKGETALMITAKCFAPKPVTAWTLIQCGADTALKNNDGKTALELVAKENLPFMRNALTAPRP